MIENLPQHFAKIFEKNADKALMIDRETGKSFSYSQFAALVSKGVSFLREKNVPVGGEIIVIGENTIELPLLFSAAWTLGVKVTPLNPDLGAIQLSEIISSTTPDLIIVNKSTGCLPELLQKIENIPSIVFSSHNQKNDESCQLLEEWDKHVGATPIFAGLDGDFTFLRIFTSGSTAAPKGLDLKAGRLISNEVEFCKTLDLDASLRFYNILPMSYLGGVHNLFLLPMSVGASFVLDKPLGPTNIFGFWEFVEQFSINALWFSPTMLTMLMVLRDDDNIAEITAGVKKCLVGMAPLAISTKAAFEHRFGLELLENYALSETAFISTYLPGQKYIAGCKGDLLASVNIKIIDGDGYEVELGKEGEILVDTPFMLEGYANASELDSAAITPEGFKTGDVGFIKNNKLYVNGRIKDLIIRGGLNISPALVEGQIAKLDYISDVAIVGIPHKVYGEEVAAAIVLTTEVKIETIEQDLENLLPQFQVPKSFIISDTLPVGLTGKIDKKAVRQMFD